MNQNNIREAAGLITLIFAMSTTLAERQDNGESPTEGERTNVIDAVNTVASGLIGMIAEEIGIAEARAYVTKVAEEMGVIAPGGGTVN